MSRSAEIYKILGTCRPSRWEHLRIWEGKDLPGKRIGNGTRKVTEISYLGEQDLVDISTSTQTFIAAGLCHHNCRQIGISTVSLAFDLFWVFKYRALSGALITHDEPSRDQFRATLGMYYDGLPEQFKQPKLADNRNGMIFANKSRLMFRVAGVKKSGGGSLGRSAALPFLHATEVSSWGDPEGVKSLKASLAEKNPRRFYHWESTARGFNHFWDMWEDAKKATTHKAIFVTFWKNDFYRAPRHSDMWMAYWGAKGRLTPTERDWISAVKSLYQYDVDDEQIAWYRWKLNEEFAGDEMAMYAEFPPTEEHAFVATGSQFFTSESISDGYKRQRTYDKPQFFRVQIGTHFSDTCLLATPLKLATLFVWEEPNAKGVYVMGADPAYGSSEWADRFCLSVWRCYADRMVQVAEFVDPDMATYSFAWVLAYLAGAYQPCRVNLEINGPGQGVLSELQNMRRGLVGAGGKDRDPKQAREANVLGAVTKNISQYLYRRLDSVSGTANAIHTLMGHDFKERMLNTFRDYYERGMVTVKSRGLLDEMKGIVREGGAAPAAPDKAKDDRVIAAALGCLAWNDQERTTLLARNYTFDLVTKSEQKGPESQVDRMVANYLAQIGKSKNQPGFRRGYPAQPRPFSRGQVR